MQFGRAVPVYLPPWDLPAQRHRSRRCLPWDGRTGRDYSSSDWAARCPQNRALGSRHIRSPCLRPRRRHLRHSHIPRAVIYERFHNGSLPVCRVSDFMLHRRGEESLKAIPPPSLKARLVPCATELCRPSHSCASREAARDQWTDCHSPRRHNRDSSSPYPRRTPGIPCGVQ